LVEKGGDERNLEGEKKKEWGCKVACLAFLKARNSKWQKKPSSFE
jgi:hypothetical protein